MREFLKTSVRWLGIGSFLALVYFTAPSCALQTTGTCVKDCEGDNPPNPPCEGVDCPDPPCDKPSCMPPDPPPLVFQPGDNPTSAIMCDFPKPMKPDLSTCATQAEVDSGNFMPMSEAATALVTGKTKPIALDWSVDAMAECLGLPKKVEYLAGSFPDGAAVCLNCGSQIPLTYANPTKACIAKCEDLVAASNGFIPADVHDYCVTNAHTSTNFTKDACYDGACSSGGTPVPGFVDPRRNQEPVTWVDKIGADDNGGTNSLTQTAATIGWQAGAASAQTVLNGDAWVEFSVTETNTGHRLSLRSSCAEPINCQDMDASEVDLGFIINLGGDGLVYTQDLGSPESGPFGSYSAGERYRIRARDNHNGYAVVSYSRVIGACSPGTECVEDVFNTSATLLAYPLRVDASLRQQNSTLANVTIVRIIP